MFLRFMGVALCFALSFSPSARAEDVLAKALTKGVAGALKGALCQPGSISADFLKSIDGFAVSGGVTLKGFANASCEMSFWRKANTTASMKTQGFCYPGVSVSTSKAAPVNASISLMYGCNGDPQNYKGYFVSGGVSGLRHNWGVGDRVFEEAALFTGLAQRAKGSDGQSFDQLVNQFRVAKSGIEAGLKELRANPLGKLAQKSVPGSYDNFQGEMSSADLLANFMAKQESFLKEMDHLMDKAADLRTRIRATSNLPKGEERTNQEKQIVTESLVLQSVLEDTRLEISPYVSPFFTSTNLDGMVMKNSAKSNFARTTPPYVLAQEKTLIEKMKWDAFMTRPSLDLFPSRPPSKSGVYMDPKTGKQVGNLYRVPVTTGMPGSLINNNPSFDKSLPFVLPEFGGKEYDNWEIDNILDSKYGRFPKTQTNYPKASLHSIQEFQKATAGYQDVLTKALSAIDAARGVSFVTDHQRAALAQGKTPNLDYRPGAVAKSDWLSGCNSISIPLDNTILDLAKVLPAAIGVAAAYTAGGGRMAGQTLMRNPQYVAAKAEFSQTAKGVVTNRRPYLEVGGGVSHYYMAGPEGSVATAEPVRGLLDALNSCGGNRVAQGNSSSGTDLVAHGTDRGTGPLTPLRPEPDGHF